MPANPHRYIAESFLPDRHHYWYSRCKLATDPLYAAVRTALGDSREPLLDLGCGIGLLLQSLRLHGFDMHYHGVDADAGKIELARKGIAKRNLSHTRFDVCDLSIDFPEHRGTVAVLDVLQYFTPERRTQLLAHAAKSVTTAGKLIIRAGLNDDSWRAALTRRADRFAHWARWMRSPPASQPTQADIADVLTAQGLKSTFQPLRGRTPFNNWLVVAQRA